MTTKEANRLLAACSFLGEHEEERRLLHSEVDRVDLFRSGTSDTYVVAFGDGEQAAFKSIEGADKPSTVADGHTPVGVLLNDVAAWLVARALDFEDLVGPVVITTCSLGGVSIGSLQQWHGGNPSGAGWEHSNDIRAAALFDAVIGQQDRNGSNFNYDSGSDSLGLFDNSFAFCASSRPARQLRDPPERPGFGPRPGRSTSRRPG